MTTPERPEGFHTIDACPDAEYCPNLHHRAGKPDPVWESSLQDLNELERLFAITSSILMRELPDNIWGWLERSFPALIEEVRMLRTRVADLESNTIHAKMERIERVCKDVLAQNPDARASYKAGKSIIGFLTGQAVRETKGTINARTLSDTFKRLLESE